MNLDPNAFPPIGRQPASYKITPSAPRVPPWYGAIRGGEAVNGAIVGGERFPVQQQNALIAMGRDVPTADAVTAYRHATDREFYWPNGTLPPRFAFECPVLEGLADGSFKVISPSGAIKIIRADGWVKAPIRRGKFGGY